METDQRVWTEKDRPLLTEFYKEYYFGETRPPSSIRKQGNAKGNNTLSKKGNSLNSLTDQPTPSARGETLTKVLKILFSNNDRSFKITKIEEWVNRDFDEQEGWVYKEIASYDAVKHAVYQLVKYGIIKRMAHHYYKLKDIDAAKNFLEGKRVPLMGTHPDNGEPLIPEGKREQKGNTLPDTKRQVKVVFHNQRFRGLQIPSGTFEHLLSEGLLKPQRGKARSRQWRYEGKSFEIHISDKSYTAWGVLTAKGWREEMMILRFPLAVIAMVPHRVTTHAAIEDTDDEFSFVVNNRAEALKMTFDKGSQTFNDEYEFEGKLEDVNTAKMLITDPCGSVNKLSQIEQAYSYLAQCQGNLVSFAAGTKYSLMELKEKVTNIETVVCKHNERADGVDYHR